MSMAHSLEARVPFLDRAVMELSRRIPPRPAAARHDDEVSAQARHGRPAARPSVIGGKKRGFNVPDAGVARRRAARVHAGHARAVAAPRAQGLFDPAAVDAADATSTCGARRPQPRALDAARAVGRGMDDVVGRGAPRGGAAVRERRHERAHATTRAERRRLVIALEAVEGAGDARRLRDPDLSGFVPDGGLERWWQVADRRSSGCSSLLPISLAIAFATKLTSRGPGPLPRARASAGTWSRSASTSSARCSSTPRQRIGARLLTPGDPLYTPIGRFLKRTKLDEIPQLLNVVRGDMNLGRPAADPSGLPRDVDARDPELRGALRRPPGHDRASRSSAAATSRIRATSSATTSSTSATAACCST